MRPSYINIITVYFIDLLFAQVIVCNSLYKALIGVTIIRPILVIDTNCGYGQIKFQILVVISSNSYPNNEIYLVTDSFMNVMRISICLITSNREGSLHHQVLCSRHEYKSW